MEKINGFKIIGICVETTNQDGQSAQDIGKLWQRFSSENISDQITNKASVNIYSIYTDYESDYTGKYLSILGFEVNSLEHIPPGMIGREFGGGNYIKFVASGEMPNAIMNTWREIWDRDNTLNRKYTADFEIYGEMSQNGRDSEVEIFIAIKNE